MKSLGLEKKSLGFLMVSNMKWTYRGLDVPLSFIIVGGGQWLVKSQFSLTKSKNVFPFFYATHIILWNKIVQIINLILHFFKNVTYFSFYDLLIYILVPSEFARLLQYYTQQGFRVIGAASKQLKVNICSRRRIYWCT